MSERFRVLVADPPWPFDDNLGGEIRGAEAHYNVLSMQQIRRFPLPPMYENSILFLWRVSSMQQEALDVLNAWDFRLHSELVWKKLTKHGKRHFGMGRIVRAEHETCLIAVSGKPIILDKSVRSIFEAPTGRHSEKPDVFYKLVERLSAGPYAELFARRHRAGWTTFGDQLPALEDQQHESHS